ncbi:glycoside hydrolase family 32 protein [Cohnella zeiphila]|uniref:Glycoside hydrolase family 32 protein n=1 Tax=Cohnella zeiphila TaxID=2761120 RepID=A0A7X0SR53_9BACL|nr:glycoside hydrolase family 32 protein [Cohnella zeiphila]MBB6734566.1 glycoside hydrolase family 32 protein [Cohnella zeiphila]
MNPSSGQDDQRPRLHFTPPGNWMNDPNGLVFCEGEYHLFYQHHPFDLQWGPMHWGHAVSRDLIHWEHLPIALAPDEHGTIFSGCAVVDENDTSGFFGGGKGLVAVFTQHAERPQTREPLQRQSIAYSKDNGRTWTKYAGNPVLGDESVLDFRDPKAIWHEAAAKWVMVVSAGDRVRFYTSPDLKEWTFASDFGAGEGSHAGVWECPDLFELPVDGGAAGRKWVLMVSVGGDPDDPAGSGTQYFVGSFDGTAFVNDHPSDTVLWMDRGRDNYAGATWSNIPREDGRRLFIGWMVNLKYAGVTPATVWRGAMTLPRELTLADTAEGPRIVQQPVAEVERLREEIGRWSDTVLRSGAEWTGDASGNALEAVAEFEPDTAAEVGIRFGTAPGEETIVGYDARRGELFIDRTCSGRTDFHELFPCRHAAPLDPAERRLRLWIFVDRSSVEVFAGDGRLVMTDLIFPSGPNRSVALYSLGGDAKLSSLTLYRLA